ncbi:MAG: ATP phosphoribosyltransferase [Chloroflexota bacterium]
MRKIRLALPSKGRLSEESFALLERCGLRVYRPNSRQYIATIPSYPDVQVILQRPGDIATGVRQGSLDFGITGYDMLAEKNFGQEDKMLILHDALGFGKCTVNLAAPNESGIVSIADLRERARLSDTPIRIATKFPHVTTKFLDAQNISSYRLIDAEGTLEIAPMIGFTDVIVDLISSGVTLRENGLTQLAGGEILRSQSTLVANRAALREREDALAFARTLLENIEAHLRAKDSVMIVANMRGESADSIAEKVFSHSHLTGLRGPTIAPVYTRNGGGNRWFSISIAVSCHELDTTIGALRSIGGSGVIVTPALFVFEEEPLRYRAMIEALKN